VRRPIVPAESTAFVELLAAIVANEGKAVRLVRAKGMRTEQQQIIELLLEYGADAGARDANGNRPRI
jgi:hypothetical protein